MTTTNGRYLQVPCANIIVLSFSSRVWQPQYRQNSWKPVWSTIASCKGIFQPMYSCVSSRHSAIDRAKLVSSPTYVAYSAMPNICDPGRTNKSMTARYPTAPELLNMPSTYSYSVFIRLFCADWWASLTAFIIAAPWMSCKAVKALFTIPSDPPSIAGYYLVNGTYHLYHTGSTFYLVGEPFGI